MLDSVDISVEWALTQVKHLSPGAASEIDLLYLRLSFMDLE